ncbi:MAG: ROK family protein [Candidatus Zixiibacteriota bacterium]|nr:MAG: ROK family protein [candidate division Zixibacteria bacterium]
MVSDESNKEGSLVLGIDIGGSALKSAPVDTLSGGIVSELFTVPLPETATPDAMTEAAGVCIDHFEWSGPIGCGYPGVVKGGVVLTAAHVSREWIEVDIIRQLSQITRGAVTVLNDADAAGLAEMRFGAGKDYNRANGGTVLMVTLGTGIGTALFHDGQLFPNTEFGHVFLSSGIEAEDIAAASIRTKEDLSWQVWGGRVNKYLHEMAKLVSPDLIILGGGVSENFDSFQQYLNSTLEIRVAALGNTAGIVGAALAATEGISI